MQLRICITLFRLILPMGDAGRFSGVCRLIIGCIIIWGRNRKEERQSARPVNQRQESADCCFAMLVFRLAALFSPGRGSGSRKAFADTDGGDGRFSSSLVGYLRDMVIFAEPINSNAKFSFMKRLLNTCYLARKAAMEDL